MQPQNIDSAIARVLAERGQANLGTFIDGLQSLIAQAKAGQPGARAALRQLRAGLRELEALGLDVSLPGES
jgi:hypothetical protein